MRSGGFERKEADSATASLGSRGVGAPLADGNRVGWEIAAGQGDGELTVAAAAARMEWVERHGNNAGTMDVEASDMMGVETSDMVGVEASAIKSSTKVLLDAMTLSWGVGRNDGLNRVFGCGSQVKIADAMITLCFGVWVPGRSSCYVTYLVQCRSKSFCVFRATEGLTLGVMAVNDK